MRAGKVRAIGASNYPAWLLAWAVSLQDRNGWAPFVSLQPQYSLVERSIEVEILPFCRAAGIGLIPWGPLGAGFLTGKYSRDTDPPEGSRMAEAGDDIEEARHRRAIERNFRVVDEAQAIAEERARRSPRSRSRGCSACRAWSRRSSARARSSRWRTCSARPTCR